jgi:hypothetical protein
MILPIVLIPTVAMTGIFRLAKMLHQRHRVCPGQLPPNRRRRTGPNPIYRPVNLSNCIQAPFRHLAFGLAANPAKMSGRLVVPMRMRNWRCVSARGRKCVSISACQAGRATELATVTVCFSGVSRAQQNGAGGRRAVLNVTTTASISEYRCTVEIPQRDASAHALNVKHGYHWTRVNPEAGAYLRASDRSTRTEED